MTNVADDLPHEFRQRFVARLGFELDPFQVEAFDAIDNGRSVLVAAPTGSGKTLVAEYAVARALDRRRPAIYTTPLKALSNQKYRDFSQTYGTARTGLLTGDVSRNGGGSIVVMTTEVLRNMIYAAPGGLRDLRCVVLDEVHYLEDPYRGSVWEEIILSAPPEVTLVCLSATVSNARELATWMEKVRGSTAAVIEQRRPIELRHLYVMGDRKGQLAVMPTFVDGAPNDEALAADAKSHTVGMKPRAARPRERFSARPRRIDVLERFALEDLLPAIYFVFSRAGCDEAVRSCVDAGVRLTNAHERPHIREIADRHVESLSDADLRVLGYGSFRNGLEVGIAPHHAGLVPPFREAVEELFGEALVKVVFATETLSLGINMPARSVIIESLSKFGGAGHADLTPGEYLQLTGRAGRRGIDEVGYAAVLWSPYHGFEEVAALAQAPSRALRSSFRPTYNMAVNLMRRYDHRAAYELVSGSFAQHLSSARLTDELDAVVGVLEARSYVRDWRVLEAGQRLGGIYHDCDLLIAEAISAGLLSGLDQASLAALVSSFTYEARRLAAAPALPTSRLLRRFAELEALGAELRAEERRVGLPRTRRLDPSFGHVAFAWAKGAALDQLVAAPSARGRERPTLSGGDFVRNVKQLGDLLRQIAAVEAGSRLGDTAARAAENLLRGVVAASSGLGLEENEVGNDPRP